ncbi:4-hydroxythreonine-4-phosphate dehydrogenase PdxA [Xylophilus rhododendri]|uniref:4-hydroxythreonine-4-phosphate dehydrogenase PdxA n=1 Tax=Xylophilus rhododendri TaxID=2697032 RepID=A0A857J0G5_9BURK|nr:4-hydroxythreonine-4-phosphate dehydrogenase PdxA [Xylophilus rhododendri]QHI96601.1 4-hydroxythreonine-4-phosphate dehydrogenase PdxA [Xylophilus rhododendri]
MTPRIALAIGDPAGIGPEIIARLLSEPGATERAEIFLIATDEALEAGARAAGVPRIQPGPRLHIVDWPGRTLRFAPSQATPENGRFILDSLTFGTRMVENGEADALCFAPLNKGAMRLGGMHEEDEMRWFAKLLRYDGPCGEFNVLGPMWTARVTSHVALREVSDLLKPEGVAGAIGMLTQALKAAGTAEPRIGVCGLNPHNGDNGNYGSEEGEIITPGIELAASRGFPALGPFPADTIFLRANKGQLDGIVTMYHDQGQIATKLLGFDIGVTVEGGLPIPVTTPAHGTAYDIVGQGVAQSTAMAAAFDLACRMGASHRAAREAAALPA